MTLADLRSAARVGLTGRPSVNPIAKDDPQGWDAAPAGHRHGDVSDDHAHTAPTIGDLVDAQRRHMMTSAPAASYAYLRRQYEQENDVVITESYCARHIRAGAFIVAQRPAQRSARPKASRSSTPDRAPHHDDGPRAARRWWRPRAPRGQATRTIKIRYDGADAAAVQPAFEAALWKARAMEREASMMLRGPERQIITEMTYSVIVYLLGVLDAVSAAKGASPWDGKARVDGAITSAMAHLDELEKLKASAAKKASLRQYVAGLPLGAALAAALVVAAYGMDALTTHAAVVSLCLASGAVGAVVSVMTRVNRGTGIVVDTAQGAFVTTLSGTFRPLIGALFGVALYVLVSGGIVPIAMPDAAMAPTDVRNAFFFAGIAFIAGFSERWAQDTVVHSAPRIPDPTAQANPQAPSSMIGRQ